MDSLPSAVRPSAASRTQPQRILVGASVRCEQHLFDAYYASLWGLIAPRSCELSFAFVADCTLAWPDDALVIPAPARPDEAAYAVNDVTHEWQIATFEHLARCKQLLLDHARDSGFDYVFLVDSDLLLEPTTLLSLHAAAVDIVSGVFWTAWQPNVPELPQCWLAHPYDLAGLGMQQHEYLRALRWHSLVRVLGGGACTLIRTSVLDKVRYHPRLTLPQGGMWQGEDRTFAVLAQQHRIYQYADAWPRIVHAYRPAQRTPSALADAAASLNARRQLYAKPGDWVSVKLTPLEDPGLEDGLLPEVRNVRCRLGERMLARELEDALLATCVGDFAIVDLTIDEGHPIYPPGKRVVRMELIDARPA